jgi:hypothetical protein
MLEEDVMENSVRGVASIMKSIIGPLLRLVGGEQEAHLPFMGAFLRYNQHSVSLITRFL